jgi:hypothetical protein
LTIIDDLSEMSREQRPGLGALLDYARPGDAIVVVGIDRRPDRQRGVVLQIAGRAHGGNFFHRGRLAAQLLAQASNRRRIE